MADNSFLAKTRKLGFAPEIDPHWQITPRFGLTLTDVERICAEIETDRLGDHYDEPTEQWSNTYEIELQVSEGLYPTYLIVEVYHQSKTWREKRWGGGYERLTDHEYRVVNAHFEVDDGEGFVKYSISPLGMAVLRKAIEV